jgi:cell division protein FtsQ
VLLAVGVAGGLAVTAVYVAGWTPVMGVRSVEVVGPATLPTAQLVATAGIAEGTPMMRADLRAATARLADLPQVASVDVRRQWPRTIVISVTERDAVAVRKAGDGWELLDANGSPFAMAPTKPKNLPVMTASGDAAADTAMVQAVAGMPPELRAQVASVQAASPTSIRLTLRKGGAVVNWGSVDQSAFKAEVLLVLLKTDAGWYDVTNPQTPTTAAAPPKPADPAATPAPGAGLPSPAATGSPQPSASPQDTAAATEAPVTEAPSAPAPAVSPLGVVPD